MKITKTYSIESKLFDKFDDICKKKNLNRSQWMEDKIKDFVAKEMIIDPKSYYKLRFDTEDNYLTVVEKKDNFVIMSNGNKIDVFDFEKMYEEIDPFVTSVVNAINGNSSNVEPVDPEDFLNKRITDPERVKEIFEKVDPKKIADVGNPRIIKHIDPDISQSIKLADEVEKKEFIRKHNEEKQIKSEESEKIILTSPTEPIIEIGQRVNLDDGKDIYLVTKKCNMSGAVWIQKLDISEGEPMGLCKEVEYIDNLCRLKIIR